MTLLLPGNLCAGVDEAGRGPLAGPVCAAAVILDPKNIPRGLNDSKKLSQKQREKLFTEIIDHALAVSISFACNREVDAVNIHYATLNAMQRAVYYLSICPKNVLVDGKFVPKNLGMPAQAVVDGDATHTCIAAASIVAKVMRDRKMIFLDRHYPAYGFASHKGYGTRRHLEALQHHGPCVFHRRSFAPVQQADMKRAV
ncbi:MAG: ribonuclease HII [Pseudomonadota bacterium]